MQTFINITRKGIFLFFAASTWLVCAENVIFAATDANSTLDILNAEGAVYFNIKDYGAIGDGVTDDTTAILAAVDAANQISGIVYVPQGQFLYSRDIVLASQVRLEGSISQYGGWSESQPFGSVLVCNTDNAKIIAGGYCDVINIAFAGSGAGEHIRLNGPGITIEGCLFLGRTYGIYGDNTGSLLYVENFEKNTFAKQTSHCVYFVNVNSSMPEITFHENRFKKGYAGALWGSAIHIDGTAGFASSSIKFNVFDQFEDSNNAILDFPGIQRVVDISDNHFESQQGTGIGIIAYGRFNITANYFSNLDRAIYANAMFDSFVAANEFDTIKRYNIQLGGDASNNVICADSTEKITAYGNNILLTGNAVYIPVNSAWVVQKDLIMPALMDFQTADSCEITLSSATQLLITNIHFYNDGVVSGVNLKLYGTGNIPEYLLNITAKASATSNAAPAAMLTTFVGINPVSNAFNIKKASVNTKVSNAGVLGPKWNISGTASPRSTLLLFLGPDLSGEFIGSTMANTKGKWAFISRSPVTLPVSSSSISILSLADGAALNKPLIVR